jgi:hypothetical protein
MGDTFEDGDLTFVSKLELFVGTTDEGFDAFSTAESLGGVSERTTCHTCHTCNIMTSPRQCENLRKPSENPVYGRFLVVPSTNFALSPFARSQSMYLVSLSRSCIKLINQLQGTNRSYGQIFLVCSYLSCPLTPPILCTGCASFSPRIAN